MIEVKWTPAPWTAEKSNVKTPVNSRFKHVAMVNWGWGFDEEEHNANANLIAAAPELYGALRQALALIKANAEDDSDEFSVDLYYKAREALAKARGETQ